MSDNADLENMKNELEDLKEELEDAQDELEDEGCIKKMEGFFWEVTKIAICIFFIFLGIGVAGFGFYALWIEEEKVYLESVDKVSDIFDVFGVDLGLDNSIQRKFNWLLFIVGLVPIVPCLVSVITRIMSYFDRFKYCSLVMPTFVLQLTLGLYLLAPLLILVVVLFDKIICILFINAIPFLTEIFMSVLPAIFEVILEKTVGQLIQPFTSYIEKLMSVVNKLEETIKCLKNPSSCLDIPIPNPFG